MTEIDTDSPVDQLRTPPVLRILALSGGGYRGPFTAEILARVESETRRKVRDLADLVIDLRTNLTTFTGGTQKGGRVTGVFTAQ